MLNIEYSGDKWVILNGDMKIIQLRKRMSH